MTEESDELVLELLHRIDEKLDRLIADVQDLKLRMTACAETMARRHRGLDFRHDHDDHV